MDRKKIASKLLKISRQINAGWGWDIDLEKFSGESMIREIRRHLINVDVDLAIRIEKLISKNMDTLKKGEVVEQMIGSKVQIGLLKNGKLSIIID